MPRVAPVVPAETDLLCESCGYTLNGLPESGKCPECGTPIASSIGTHRSLSAFEQRRSFVGFLQTTAATIFRPTLFYRHLRTRCDTVAARHFAQHHVGIAAGLFGLAALGHFFLMFDKSILSADLYVILGAILLALPALYLGLFGLIKLAAWLTAIEARFWGMRLPYPIVMRAMEFHAAHYLPVGLLACVVVFGYMALLDRGIVDHTRDATYLYTLSAGVVVSAIYLFQTYWIAMRNVRYANH